MSPRSSPHTTASRDSMIPSATNGAIIGSAASKKHEKLPRGLSATMIVLPRSHREQRRNLPKLLTDDRENGANIPGDVPEVYVGRDGAFSANTPTQCGSRNKPDRDCQPSRQLRRSLCVCGAHPVGMDARRHTGGAAHHRYQPWRGGVADPVGEILPSQR